MKQFSVRLDACGQIRNVLDSDEISRAIQSARSILVQIYSDVANAGEIQGFIAAIHSVIPNAVILGATSAGGILAGHLMLNSTIVSITCFDRSEILPIFSSCQPGNEYEMGAAIAGQMASIPNLKGVLLLASPILVNCAHLLAGINDRLSGVVVFGGGAAGSSPRDSLVFLNEQGLEGGEVAAIGLAGDDLYLETTISTGWKALGPSVRLTDVDGFDILKINDAPAFDVFNKYLGLHPRDDLFLLEFPLLIERNGVTLARNPVSSGVDGRVSLIADVNCGECARLGYLDMDGVIAHLENAYNVLDAFKPEAIFIYSCICRRFALQDDIELEIYPFFELAPVSGFFTHGEFYRTGNGLEVLNSSEILVGMREGIPVDQAHPAGQIIRDEVNHYRMRHLTMTSRLFHFIGTLTDQLEEANRILKFQAEHDQLTGVYNRHALDEHLNLQITCSQPRNHQLSFILFDIDHFKLVNDEFGHLAGDYVLKSVSEEVSKTIRANDTLYRYGGEEFLLMLLDTPLEGAVVVAEKIRANIEGLKMEFRGVSLPTVTASFGVACHPDHGETIEKIISALDAALYCSKSKGRNIISIAEKGN